MTHVGFLLKIKQERIDEYKQHHREVWPEMLEALRQTGWHNYSLFMKDDGQMFGYFETPGSFQEALDAMRDREVNTKWQEFMAPYFESPDGDRPDDIMIELEQVFYLE